MPFYNFEYITPLSRSQKDQLAAAVTQIHTRKFITPSLFVNVRFTDCSNFDDYVGGVQVLFFFANPSFQPSSINTDSQPLPNERSRPQLTISLAF